MTDQKLKNYIELIEAANERVKAEQVHRADIFKFAKDEGTIIQIDALPTMETKPAEKTSKGWIISHSESGHHHLLTGGDVMERTSNVPKGMKILYAVLDNPEVLIQDAATPHGSHNLLAGFYEFRIAREYDPFAEQARIVAD
jgi:hypothetical protein